MEQEMSDSLDSLQMVRVRGDSMIPTLYAGDQVMICKADCYGKGDIIVYPYKDKGLVIHRLIAESGDTYICRGDNNQYFERIKKETVLGKVIWMKGRKTRDV